MPDTTSAEFDSLYRDLEAIAVRAALAGAAEVGLRIGRATDVRSKSGPTDPVTDADRASERAVAAVLTEARPHDGFLGEEDRSIDGATGLRWVVDPLDGTVNYLYGLPSFAVSVACEERRGERWEPVAGAVYDVNRSELFAAALHAGARLGGHPIRVSSHTEIAMALVATGFSYDSGSRARQADVLRHVVPRVRCVRSSGSAALELCWVASGRYDAFYEDELEPWDTAAGRIIVTEAGGVVSPLGRGGVLACAGALHPGLVALLAEAGAGHHPS